MRLSPRLASHGKVIRRLALRLAQDGEAIYFLGWDWKIHVAVVGRPSDPNLTELIECVQRDRCWRGLLYVSTPGEHLTKVVYLEVGGAKTYGLNIRSGTQSAHWCVPDPTHVELIERASIWT